MSKGECFSARAQQKRWERSDGAIQVNAESPAQADVVRQRPVSAPPKALPFARQSALADEDNPRGIKSYVEKCEANTRGITNRRNRSAGTSRESHTLDKEELIHEEVGEASAGHEIDQVLKQNMFARTATTKSDRPDREENGQSGVTGNRRGQARLQAGTLGHSSSVHEHKEREEGRERPLQSQDFGLHQWKEYAVLR